MEVSEAARLKALEDGNANLKCLLADTMLDNIVLDGPSSVILFATFTATKRAHRAHRHHKGDNGAQAEGK